MSPASRRLSMGQLWRWSIVASWCLCTLAVAQQPGPPKPAPTKPVGEAGAKAAHAGRAGHDRRACSDQGRGGSNHQGGNQDLADPPIRAGCRTGSDRSRSVSSSTMSIFSPRRPDLSEMPDARQRLRQMVRNFGNPSNPMEKAGLVYVNNLLLTRLEEAAGRRSSCRTAGLTACWRWAS